MNLKDKIDKIKDRSARLAIKAATVATLLSGASTAVSCSTYDRDVDENGDRTENTEGVKTSVVFRAKQSRTKNNILLENGDVLSQVNDTRDVSDGAFLEPGDTVTYEGNDVKAIRYKGGNGKQVNFGKIGKLGKDITD